MALVGLLFAAMTASYGLASGQPGALVLALAFLVLGLIGPGENPRHQKGPR